MPRLIDYIRTSRKPIAQLGAAMVDAGHWHAQEEQLREFLTRIPVIVADNIDEFIADGVANQRWKEEGDRLDPRDVPNLFPPFPAFWYEWKWFDPAYRENMGITHAGMLVECFEPEPGEQARHRFEFACLPFVLTDDLNVGHIVYRPVILSDGDGVMIDCKVVDSPLCRHPMTDEATGESWRKVSVALVTPLLIGVSFLNCRNVHLIDQIPEKPLSAAFRRRHGQWLMRYKLIDIFPMSRIIRETLGEGAMGIQRAMHIVRGHQKTYTKEHPLFGRHVGTYFWHQAVHGSMARGENRSAYRVRMDGKKK